MLYVSNEIIRDVGLSNEEVLTYVFLQILTYSPNYDSVTFNVSQIVDQAYGFTGSHAVYTRMSATFKSLVDKGYLDVVQESPKLWRIYMSSYKVAEDGYVAVDAANVRAIMDLEKITYKPAIIRCYLLILSSIYSKTRVGTYDQTWFCNILKTGRQTIGRYMKILEDNKLIYVYRAADNETSNTYGRYEDAELVRMEGQKRAKGREAHENANAKRKYVSMYRFFLDGYEYDKDTLKEILRAMQARNNELLELGANAKGQVYDLQPLIDKINNG